MSSPKRSGQSAIANFGKATPSASWISTLTLPTAEVEKFNSSEPPVEVMGCVVNSPPDAPAFTETKPSALVA